MQGYNLEIRHIPGKRNPADTLSRQDKKDALGRKTAVHDANADLVRELRVPSNANDEAIQEALKRLFNAQGQFSQIQMQLKVRPAGHRDQFQSQIRPSRQSVQIRPSRRQSQINFSPVQYNQSPSRSSPVQDQFNVSVSRKQFSQSVYISHQ